MGLRLICLWPGLPGAWFRGQVAQLVWAVVWCWAASVLLMATFVWPYWFSPLLTRTLWFLSIFAWCGLTAWEHWRFSSWFAVVKPHATEAFAGAQAEYLKGNWFAAEAALLAILHENQDDADALLLLVSVLRRTHRWQPAARRLQQLELLDASAKWRFEIARERRFLEAATSDSPSDSTEPIGADDKETANATPSACEADDTDEASRSEELRPALESEPSAANQVQTANQVNKAA